MKLKGVKLILPYYLDLELNILNVLQEIRKDQCGGCFSVDAKTIAKCLNLPPSPKLLRDIHYIMRRFPFVSVLERGRRARKYIIYINQFDKFLEENGFI